MHEKVTLANASVGGPNMYSAASDSRLSEHLTPTSTMARSHDSAAMAGHQLQDNTLTRNKNNHFNTLTNNNTTTSNNGAGATNARRDIGHHLPDRDGLFTHPSLHEVTYILKHYPIINHKWNKTFVTIEYLVIFLESTY